MCCIAICLPLLPFISQSPSPSLSLIHTHIIDYKSYIDIYVQYRIIPTSTYRCYELEQPSPAQLSAAMLLFPLPHASFPNYFAHYHHHQSSFAPLTFSFTLSFSIQNFFVALSLSVTWSLFRAFLTPWDGKKEKKLERKRQWFGLESGGSRSP